MSSFSRGQNESFNALKTASQAETTANNRKISTLQSTLETAQQQAEMSKANYGALKKVMAEEKQKLSVAEANHDAEVARLRRNESNLLSSLDTLKREVDDEKQRLSAGIADFKQWMHEGSVDAGTLVAVPQQFASSSDIHHVLAHNALLKVRSENWNAAYNDAKKSISVRPSAVAYITQALARIGNGETEEATQQLDLVFGNCHPDESNFLLLVKSIITFVASKHDVAISRIHDLITASKDDDMTYCCIQVLGKMYSLQGDYARAVQSLEQAQGLAPSCSGSDLETISLIFGWTFDGLRISVQRYRCEDLYASGHFENAAEVHLGVLDSFSEEINASKALAEWVRDFKNKSLAKLEALADAALASGRQDDAIAQYTSMLSLNPVNQVDVLVKRSKARAARKLWADALLDANEVIKLDSSSYLGHERKFVALHGAEDYGEAINALLRMLSIMENSPDEEIRRLRANYTSPLEAFAAIDTAIHEFFAFCPLVLIDVTTGRLCDAQERIRTFKSETPFKKLVSETATTKIDRAHVRLCVGKYFKWTMFSHTWEGKEPTFQDVNVVGSVWDLDESPLNEKLRQFCATARDDDGRWVWSDTCCIDKSTSAILSQSLTSMYTWYAEAAETLVYLADVLELGDLLKSRWMTRAWTLQELLASKVIRFYAHDWKPYLDDKHANHKESPAIREELARAMGVDATTITSFRPEDLGVREKLRLASTRNATVEEDIAYSLIGIFSSDIVPRYGLGKTAIGQLLENIVAQTGDVTVIAWTGKSLSYNSALPASLVVYSQPPYSPPPFEANELDARVEQLCSRLEIQTTLPSYYQVVQLPRATFFNRRLQLPCIIFKVTKIGVHELDSSLGNLYRATVALLGKVEFRTLDVMPLKKPRKLVFVHPWLRDLCDDHVGFVSDDESEATSEADSCEVEGESEEGSGDGTEVGSEPASPPSAEPSTEVDPFTQSLRLIACLERPFDALLLELQSDGKRYKRVAAENAIIVQGIAVDTNPKDIRAKVLEII